MALYGKVFNSVRALHEWGAKEKSTIFTRESIYAKVSYYYNKDFECDFIGVKDDKTIAIQVCYELTFQNTAREVGGLQKLKIRTDEKVLITYNQDHNSIKKDLDDGIMLA